LARAGERAARGVRADGRRHSAGNDARGTVKYYPATGAGVLAVGGTNAKGTRFTKYDDRELQQRHHQRRS
jgi:hypothetical protein